MEYDWFHIELMLTKDGFNRIDQILEVFFTHIELMKEQGISGDIYKRDRVHEILDFYYENKITPLKEAEYLIQAMIDGETEAE